MIRRVYELTVRLEVQGDDEVAIEDGMFEMHPEFLSQTEGFDVLDVAFVNSEVVA